MKTKYENYTLEVDMGMVTTTLPNEIPLSWTEEDRTRYKQEVYDLTCKYYGKENVRVIE